MRKTLSDACRKITKTLGDISKKITWSTLSTVGKQKATRTSYFWMIFVPLTAKILRAIPSEIPLSHIKLPGAITVGLPFSWKAFYFSAVAISIGTAIYSIWCPAVIKKWSNYADFEREGSGFLQLKLAVAQYVNKEKNTSVGPTLADHYFVINPGVDLTTLIESMKADKGTEGFFASKDIQKDRQVDFFETTRHLVDDLHTTARLACALCYAVGFLFLLAVFLNTFYFVVRFAAER